MQYSQANIDSIVQDVRETQCVTEELKTTQEIQD